MQETVVFLGAGASKAIGLPLTNEILPAVLTRLRNGDLFRVTTTTLCISGNVSTPFCLALTR